MTFSAGIKSSLIGTRFEAPLMQARWLLGFVEHWKHPELWDIHLDDRRFPAVLKRLLKKDSCCVDVGAHIGSFLSLLTKIAPTGRHIAIEPITQKAAKLRRRFPNADIFALAASDTNGTSAFEIDPIKSGYSHLAGRFDHSCIVSEVETRRLDDILMDKCVDLIKLDVEGFELQALRGAAGVIARCRPPVIFECGPEYALKERNISRGDLYAFLTSTLDYEVYTFSDVLFDRGPMGFDEFRRCGIYPFRAFNFIALPCV